MGEGSEVCDFAADYNVEAVFEISEARSGIRNTDCSHGLLVHDTESCALGMFHLQNL